MANPTTDLHVYQISILAVWDQYHYAQTDQGYICEAKSSPADHKRHPCYSLVFVHTCHLGVYENGDASPELQVHEERKGMRGNMNIV